ncbi:hypothetical protein KDU71_19035 [Carboxylicivirga sediminis]|uniref:Uncharacterized protein n=1 Tax=Carboxylicivirga sediminis TaxID=2006564 RepID=A0A941IZT4_9BACT|nr:hypothetical protein [Carboxylicivirga sediminis]MBR8537673.1 hypothetical protein [Carboxylicivirga sediminis]
MQKLLFILAVSALILSSCGTKKADNKEGTHVHEDGTVHGAHEHAAPQQETFEVKEKGCSAECAKDSCDSVTKSEEDHDHDHGHDHDHAHDHSHE